VQDELVGQLINYVVAMGVELVNVELLDALVRCELCSSVLLVANLAHHLHLRAISLDVVVKLGSGHMLELLPVANIATELGAVKLGMCLQLSKGLPNDLRSMDSVASMRELTEINTVS
jgi:hypothetical protein